MMSKILRSGLSVFLLVSMTLAGILVLSHPVYADSDNHGYDHGWGYSAKSFTIQDSDPSIFVKKGGISNNHQPNQPFPVYVFITNYGRAGTPISLTKDTPVTVTLRGPGYQKDYQLTIPKGQTYATMNVTIPTAGGWSLSAQGQINGDLVAGGPWFFFVLNNDVNLVIQPSQATLSPGGTQQFQAHLYVLGYDLGDVTNSTNWYQNDQNNWFQNNWLQQDWFQNGWFQQDQDYQDDWNNWLQNNWYHSDRNWFRNNWFQITWSSSNPEVASVGSDSGLVTAGTRDGTTEITATLSLGNQFQKMLTDWTGWKGSSFNKPLTATATVTVAAPTLQITPSSVQVPVQGKAQLQAKLVYPDNTIVDVTDQANWSSDTPGVASVGTNTDGETPGLVQGVAPGDATITVTVNGVKATTPVNVPTPSLTITPSIAAINTGDSYTFTDVVYNDGINGSTDVYVLPSDPDVNWQIISPIPYPDVVIVDGGKVIPTIVTSQSDPITITVEATYKGASATANLTVVQPKLTIQPNNQTVNVGDSATFTVHYTDAYVTNQDVTSAVTWTYDSSFVSLGNTAGTFKGVEATQKATPITATYINSQGSSYTSDSVSLTVVQPSLTIQADRTNLNVGSSLQLTTSYTDANSPNGETLTDQAKWSISSSSSPQVLTVSSSGMVQALTAGSETVTVSATYNNISEQKKLTFTIWQPTLTLSPNSLVLNVGDSVPLSSTFVANYTDADHPEGEIVTPSGWSSSDSSIAAITAGSVTGKNVGNTTFSASYSYNPPVTANYNEEKVTVTAQVSVIVVSTKTATKLVVTPLTASVAAGGTVQFTANLVDQNGNNAGDVTNIASWTNSGTNVTWDPNKKGLATGVNSSVQNVPTTITAEYDGFTGTALLTVTSQGIVWEAEPPPQSSN